MKKTIFNLALATTLMAGTIFTGCMSPDEKAEEAKEDVAEAKEDLKEAKQEAASAEEWNVFKMESEVKIKANEARIAELKAKINEPGKTFDEMRAKRINALEEQNRELRNKLVAYENEQSDWEKFKREFNHDMDELQKAMNDFTEDNKN